VEIVLAIYSGIKAPIITDYLTLTQPVYRDDIKKYGYPVKINFNIQEIKKNSHFDSNMQNDMAITFTFEKGEKVILLLVEHWSDKAKFDIHRFAHYLIDLSKRFPKTDIFPVALFTDKSEKWLKEPEKEIKIVCLDETYMYFKYKLIRMKNHEAQTYSNTKSRFIAVLRSAMKRDVEKKILLTVELFTNYKEIEEDIRTVIKNMDAIDFFLEIKADEREKIIKIMESSENRRDMMLTLSQELKRRGFEKGLEEGIQKGRQEGYQEGRWEGLEEGRQEGEQEGILKGKFETADAMLKEKMPVEKVAQLTGLPLKDIKKLKFLNDIQQYKG